MEHNEVYINMFGDLQIVNIHGRIEESRYKKALPWLLLKYLLINREREVSQAELLNGPWRDILSDDNDNAVRVRLRRLREALSPLKLDGTKGLILYDKGMFRLNPSYKLILDEDRFMELMEKIGTTKKEDPEGLKLCNEALSVFCGKYLEYTPDAPWAEPYREGYRQEFLRLCYETIERTELSCDETVLPLLRIRAAAIVPEEEQLHRRIIAYLMEKRKQLELVRYVSQLSHNPAAHWIKELEI